MAANVIISWMDGLSVQSMKGTIINGSPLKVAMEVDHNFLVNQVIWISTVNPQPYGIKQFYQQISQEYSIVSIDNSTIEVSTSPMSHPPRAEPTDIIQHNIPQAESFMRSYNTRLYEDVIRDSAEGQLVTGYAGVLHSRKINFSFPENRSIHFIIPKGSVSYHQLSRGRNFRINIQKTRNYYLDGNVTKIVELVKGVEITGQITKFAYGDQSNLESLVFSHRAPLLLMLQQFSAMFKYIVSIARLNLFQIPLVSILLAISLILGSGGEVEIGRVFLIFLGLSVVQSSAALLNDYFDYVARTDDITLRSTPFTGGSRFIQNGLVRPESVFYAGLLLMIIGIVIGVYITILTQSILILVLGAFGVFLSYYYSASPIELVKRGLGELSLGLTFGPLVMLGTYFVLVEKLPVSAIFVIESGVLFLHITAIILLNNLQDLEVDTVTGKKTSVVRLGWTYARRLVNTLLLTPLFVIVILVIFSILDLTFLILLVVTPLTIWLIHRINSDFVSISELLPANYGLLIYYHLTGLIMILLNLM